MAPLKNASFRLLFVVGLLFCIGLMHVNAQSAASTPEDAPASEPGDEAAIRSLENMGVEGPAEAAGSEVAEEHTEDDGHDHDTDDLDEMASGSLVAADTENGAFEVQLHSLLFVVAPLLLSFFV